MRYNARENKYIIHALEYEGNVAKVNKYALLPEVIEAIK
jgi:hypothetical protein